MKKCTERLGYTFLRKEQKEAIKKFVLEKKDVFVCLGFRSHDCHTHAAMHRIHGGVANIT